MMIVNLSMKLPDTHLHSIICSKTLGSPFEKLEELVLSTPSGKLYAWSGETTDEEEKNKLSKEVIKSFDLPATHQCSFAIEKKYHEISSRAWSVFTDDRRAELQQVFDRTWREVMETGVLQENTKSVERFRPKVRI